MHETGAEDPRAKLHETAVDLRSEDQGAGIGGFGQERLDLLDGRRDRAGRIHPIAREVVRRVSDQMIIDEFADIPIEAQILPPRRPQSFDQALRRSIEPEDVPTAVEPCAHCRVGHDAVGRDDPPEGRSRVRLFGPAQARQGVEAPGWRPGEVDELGPMAVGQSSANRTATGSWGSDQHGFHGLNYAAPKSFASASGRLLASTLRAGPRSRPEPARLGQDDGRSACGV